MNTPISWLKVYVPDLDVDVQEFVDAMTLSGSPCRRIREER